MSQNLEIAQLQEKLAQLHQQLEQVDTYDGSERSKATAKAVIYRQIEAVEQQIASLQQEAEVPQGSGGNQPPPDTPTPAFSLTPAVAVGPIGQEPPDRTPYGLADENGDPARTIKEEDAAAKKKAEEETAQKEEEAAQALSTFILGLQRAEALAAAAQEEEAENTAQALSVFSLGLQKAQSLAEAAAEAAVEAEKQQKEQEAQALSSFLLERQKTEALAASAKEEEEKKTAEELSNFLLGLQKAEAGLQAETRTRLESATKGEQATSGVSQVFSALGGAIGQVTQGFSGLLGILGPLASVFGSIKAGVGAITGQKDVKQGIADEAVSKRIAADQAKEHAVTLSQAAEQATKAGDPNAAAKHRVAEQARGVAQKADTAAGTAEAAEGASGAIAAVGALAGVAAAAAGVVVALNSIVSASVPYVQAFAPSAVLELNQAMYDLQAVIGVGLLPIVQVATDAFRDIGATLYPIMEQLAPLFQQVANTVKGEFLAVFSTVATVVTALIPLFQLLTEVTSPVVAVMQAIGQALTAVLVPVINLLTLAIRPIIAVFQILNTYIEGFATVLQAAWIVVQAFWTTLSEALAGIFPAQDAFTKGLASIKDGFQLVAKYCILAAAALAKLVGFDSLTKNIQKALAGPEQKDATGTGAATGAQTTSFADIGKQIALRASIAQGKDPKETEEDWRKDTLALLNRLEKGDGFGKLLDESLTKFVTKLTKDLVAQLPGALGLPYQVPGTHTTAKVLGYVGETLGLVPGGTTKGI